MKTKNLLVWVVVAVVLVGLAKLSSSRRQSDGRAREQVMGKPLVAALQDPDRANAVEQIVVKTSASAMRFAKADGRWVAVDKYNYPVDFKKVSEFVGMLAELKTGQPIPASEDLLKRLQLDDVQATRVRFEDGAGAVVAELAVGKEHERAMPDAMPGGMRGGYPDGRYVKVGEQACLVSENLRGLPSASTDWLDTDIVNISGTDITEVRVQGDTGGVTLARKDGTGDLQLIDLAENETMDASKASSLTYVFSYLTFADVADPALKSDALGFDKPLRCTARTKSGAIYTMEVGGGPEGGDDRYARLSALYDPPDRAADTDEDDTASAEGAEDADSTADDAEAEKAAKTEAEVDAFNKKVGGWIYVIRSYKADGLHVNREDYLKEEEKTDEPEAPAPDPVAAPAPAETPAVEAAPAAPAPVAESVSPVAETVETPAAEPAVAESAPTSKDKAPAAPAAGAPAATPAEEPAPKAEAAAASVPAAKAPVPTPAEEPKPVASPAG